MALCEFFKRGESHASAFIQDTVHTEARERLDVPEDIATLTDLKGCGEVHGLHRARATYRATELPEGDSPAWRWQASGGARAPARLAC
ncbi:hypothetical protein [Thioalkalivibrio sp. ALJ24]|uniref:hypothetical protein n=1 Tax=Thioalkalivibrio sp. ALJ24 TaxID=545276 RepID=UPI0003A3900C|nr:hypothetical protein [Thioalkalivibrio sp. ALJ24]